MNRKKYLLLGGTGAMGKNLTSILARTSSEIHVTSRSNRKDTCSNIHYIQGDAKDLLFLKKLLQDHTYDAVIDFMVYSTEEFRERVQLLLDAAGQYVFLSSSRVYAASAEPLRETSARLLDVSEDRKYLATDEYALTKARQEDILRDSGKRNWTVIRPYITFDDYRLQLGVMEKELWLQRALSGRKILFSKDIAVHTTTLTWGFDVARGIASILGRSAAMCEIFHIATSESHTWLEILKVYLEELEKFSGKRPEIVLADHSPLLSVSEYQIRYDRYFDRRFDNSKILAFMHGESFSPPLECLRKSIRNFLQSPRFLFLNVKREALFDRITGDHMRKSELSSGKEYILYCLYRYFGEYITEKMILRLAALLRRLKHA